MIMFVEMREISIFKQVRPLRVLYFWWKRVRTQTLVQVTIQNTRRDRQTLLSYVFPPLRNSALRMLGSFSLPLFHPLTLVSVALITRNMRKNWIFFKLWPQQHSEQTNNTSNKSFICDSNQLQSVCGIEILKQPKIWLKTTWNCPANMIIIWSLQGERDDLFPSVFMK